MEDTDFEIGDEVVLNSSGLKAEVKDFTKDGKVVVTLDASGRNITVGEEDISPWSDLEHGDSDKEEGDDDEVEASEFYVAVYDEHEQRSWIGFVTKKSGTKWHEKPYEGQADYRWGTSYMSYLTPEQVMQWIRKDYSRGYDVAGPFDSAEEAKQFVADHFGGEMMESTGWLKKGVVSQLPARIADRGIMVEAETGWLSEGYVVKNGSKFMRGSPAGGAPLSWTTDKSKATVFKNKKDIPKSVTMRGWQIVLAEGAMGDLAKLGGITAAGIALGVGAGKLDVDRPVAKVNGTEYVQKELPSDMSKVKRAKDEKGNDVYIWTVKTGMKPAFTYNYYAPATKVKESAENPYKDIDTNSWHLVRDDIPIAINFPSQDRAKSFHDGHGYGKETKVVHGSQVRRNAYLKHNPSVINWPEYSKVKESFMPNKIQGFIPPFSVSGNWVNDSKGRGICEMGESREALKHIAAALNAYCEKPVVKESVGIDEIWKEIQHRAKRVKSIDFPVANMVEWLVSKGVPEENAASVIMKAAVKNGFKDVHDYYQQVKSGKVVKEAKQFTDFEDWKQAVLLSYPAQAKKIKFKGRMEGNKHTVSAEIPGEDRSFGVWDMDAENGVVLSEGKDEKIKKLKADYDNAMLWVNDPKSAPSHEIAKWKNTAQKLADHAKTQYKIDLKTMKPIAEGIEEGWLKEAFFGKGKMTAVDALNLAAKEMGYEHGFDTVQLSDAEKLINFKLADGIAQHRYKKNFWVLDKDQQEFIMLRHPGFLRGKALMMYKKNTESDTMLPGVDV